MIEWGAGTGVVEAGGKRLEWGAFGPAPDGRPVIVLAGFNGNRRTVRTLLAAGADVNAVDATGTSALIAASALGHAEVVDLLLAAGADVNLKDSGGKSALARATLRGHTRVAEALKAAGAVEEEAPADKK